MKILCNSYEYPPIGGGGSNVAHPLARSLVWDGHTIDVVTSGMRDVPAHEVMDGVNVHRVRCFRRYRHYTTTAELLTYLWPAYRKALSLQNQNGYDINHTHFALPSGLVSYLLYKKTGLPYVTTIHGSDVPGYNPDRFRIAHILAQPAWKKVISNSEKIVSASEFLKKLIQQHIDVPVEIIQNGYSPYVDMSESCVKQNRVLVVTRMFQRKGVQHFIEALNGLDHDWEIVVAGDGPYLPSLKNQARLAGLNIRFTGYIQGRELLDLYESAKVFVFPSLQENFPVVLLEAMQAGCAIITTNADGCAEVIGDAGVSVDPERPDQIRDALIALMRDEERIASYRRAGQRRIDRFRWPRIAAQYETVLQEAYRHPHAAAAEMPL